MKNQIQVSKNSFKRQKVSGRIMDNFRLRNGTVIPSEYFIHFIGVVLNEGLLKKIQIVQKDYDKIDLNVVYFNDKPSEENIKNVVNAVKDVMGKQCKVNIIETDDILPSISGKYRYTVCELQ